MSSRRVKSGLDLALLDLGEDGHTAGLLQALTHCVSLIKM